MAIITISRQLGSGGDEIAGKIAENLGYKFFGKKELEKRMVSQLQNFLALTKKNLVFLQVLPEAVTNI